MDKNRYQISSVRTDLGFGIFNYYSEPIIGFHPAIRVLDHLRSRLIEKGFHCSIIFKQTFSAERDGKTVMIHLYKNRPSVRPITETEDWMEGLDPEDIRKSIELMKIDFTGIFF